jgi:hypothetical protein
MVPQSVGQRSVLSIPDVTFRSRWFRNQLKILQFINSTFVKLHSKIRKKRLKVLKVFVLYNISGLDLFFTPVFQKWALSIEF